MTAREDIFNRVRAALGRPAGAPIPEPPGVRLRPSPPFDKVARFTEALNALGGHVVETADPRAAVESMVAQRSFLASPKISRSQVFSREACTTAQVGITSADYALADTGTLVFLSESGESRLLSLAPPCHIAVIERDKILTGLDELFTAMPDPGAKSSAMVLITGPSRTADIEMRLVRGVHGPGELHVVIVDHVTAFL